jgi:hypothetical protein
MYLSPTLYQFTALVLQIMSRTDQQTALVSQSFDCFFHATHVTNEWRVRYLQAFCVPPCHDVFSVIIYCGTKRKALHWDPQATASRVLILHPTVSHESQWVTCHCDRVTLVLKRVMSVGVTRSPPVTACELQLADRGEVYAEFQLAKAEGTSLCIHKLRWEDSIKWDVFQQWTLVNRVINHRFT